MRRRETQKIGSVLQDYVQALKIRSKLSEVSIHRHWENLMGKSMMRYTKNLEIKNGVLFVQMTSPVVRQELMMRSDKIKSALNSQIGSTIIRKVVFR